jgi:hypothetical protein
MIAGSSAGLHLKYPRLYASGDGESHFTNVAVEMNPGVYGQGSPW